MTKANRKAMILEMLSYRRPARSETETEFITRYIDSIPGVYPDKYGNRLLVNPGSKVMISTHTDTVHRMGGRQKVSLQRHGIARLGAKEKESNCLGADDTAGVYAALRMIEAGVPATFVFHRDEEIGGRGSSWLAEMHRDWLQSFDICLALDRRGHADIITTQFGTECASDAFADSLSDALDMGHMAEHGVFTDSANYTHLIPECSNLSIGYKNEHTREEVLDLEYLEEVTERLIQVDWGSIVVERFPGMDLWFDPWEDEDGADDMSWYFSKGTNV